MEEKERKKKKKKTLSVVSANGSWVSSKNFFMFLK